MYLLYNRIGLFSHKFAFRMLIVYNYYAVIHDVYYQLNIHQIDPSISDNYLAFIRLMNFIDEMCF